MIFFFFSGVSVGTVFDETGMADLILSGSGSDVETHFAFMMRTFSTDTVRIDSTDEIKVSSTDEIKVKG